MSAHKKSFLCNPPLPPHLHHHDNNAYNFAPPLPDEKNYFKFPPPKVQPVDNVWNGFMLLAAIGCILTVFITTVIMYYIYFRLCSTRLRHRVRRSRRWRTEISGGRRLSWRAVDGYYFTASPTNEGLCSSAVEALPVFVFKAEDFKEEMRCAVCLNGFEENESGRVLPNCGHSFHVECIDMWFYSHSTCPLCRQEVEIVVEVENSSAENKIVCGGAAYEVDGVQERKEREEERTGESVAIGVPATEDSQVV